MDPKDKLKELEAAVVQKALEKLDKMTLATKAKLFQGCENAHVSEMVKLCHQVRSLV